MKKFFEYYSHLSKPHKLSFWISLSTGIVLILYSGLFVNRIINAPDVSSWMLYFIPLAIGVISLIGASLIFIGKGPIGTWIILLANSIGMLTITILAQGYGFTPGIWILLIAILIPLPILPRSQQLPVLGVAISAAVTSILIDSFWNGQRIIVDLLEKQVANYIAVILGIVLLVYIFAGYRNFQIRVKLAIAFLGLTVISVSVISIQSLTLTSRYLTTNIGGHVNQIAETSALALGNELNRLVNILLSMSFSVSLQDEIRNSMETYPETPEDISEMIQSIDVEWKEKYESDRNSSLIYDRITNPVAIELRVISYRITDLGNTFVADRYGALVGSLIPVRQYDYSKESWWESVYNHGDGSIYIGLPVYDYELQGTSILIVVPIFDRIGNYFIGVLGTKVLFDGYVVDMELAAHQLGERAGNTLIFPGNPPLELSETEVQMCNASKQEPLAFQVGIDSIIPVISSENKFLTNVTKDQLRMIFTMGETWSDIDPSWPNEPIIRYLPTTDSGTFDFFVATALNDDLSGIMQLSNLHQEANEINYLDKIAGNPNAIGITGAGYYLQYKESLTPLSIDGISPLDYDNTSIRYPLIRPLFIYSSSELIREKPQVAAFINYYLSHTSQFAGELGYRSPSDESLSQSQNNLKKVLGISNLPEINPGTINGDIRIGGSSTVYLLTKRIADQFVEEGYAGAIKLESTESAFGIKQLCLLGTVDIADSSRKINDNPRASVQDHLLETLALGNENTYFEQEFRNENSLVSTALVRDSKASDHITRLGWIVVTNNPVEDALSPIRKQERASIAILLVVGGLATLGAIGFAQLLAGPIQRLSIAARNFGAGELNARAKVESSDEIGNLATSFNSMADQIRDILANLENQINERSQAVIVSAEISRKLSTILDQRQLVLMVVDEIRKSYDFYHAHIYLYDENPQYLVMVGGTGEAGKIMLERGHRIESGHGLVGQCAQENKIILVSDSSQDPNWLPNPLLPETRSEVAVPIAIGENVLGVLDVQHNIPAGITQKTAELLQSIANQVAIAVQNARLFNEAQLQAEQESIIIDINQKIQASTSIERVLEVTARELGIALGANKASVSISSKHFRDAIITPGKNN